MFGYIYITTNNINKKRYIGKKHSEVFIEDYFGSGCLIKRSLIKYGIENFEVKLIDRAETLEELNEKEKFWISFFKADKIDSFYNIASGGDGGNLISGLENKNPERYRQFIEDCRNRSLGENNPNYGNGHKISGDKNPSKRDAVRLKLSSSLKGENNPMYGLKGRLSPSFGLKRSDEYKKKMRESLIAYYDKKGRKPKPIPKTKEEISKAKSDAQKKRYQDINERMKHARYGKDNPNYGNGEKVSGSKNGRALTILCVDTGEIFYTMRDACNHAGYKDRPTFSKRIKSGKRMTTNNYVYKIIEKDNTEVTN